MEYPKMIVANGDMAGRSVEIVTIPFNIGRDTENFLVLNDNRIPPLHATITKKDDDFVLTDENENGTLVNGERIKERILKNDDTINFLDERFSFRFLQGEQGEATEAEIMEAIMASNVSEAVKKSGFKDTAQKVFAFIKKAVVIFFDVLSKILDAIDGWFLRQKDKTSGRTGKFSRYLLIPLILIITWAINLANRIENKPLKCIVRLIVYVMYICLLGVVAYASIFVLIIVAIIAVLYIALLIWGWWESQKDGPGEGGRRKQAQQNSWSIDNGLLIGVQQIGVIDEHGNLIDYNGYKRGSIRKEGFSGNKSVYDSNGKLIGEVSYNVAIVAIGTTPHDIKTKSGVVIGRLYEHSNGDIEFSGDITNILYS